MRLISNDEAAGILYEFFLVWGSSVTRYFTLGAWIERGVECVIPFM